MESGENREGEACENEGRVLVIGDMNATAVDREMEGVVGKYGVSGMNENGRKVIEV